MILQGYNDLQPLDSTSAVREFRPSDYPILFNRSGQESITFLSLCLDTPVSTRTGEIGDRLKLKNRRRQGKLHDTIGDGVLTRGFVWPFGSAYAASWSFFHAVLCLFVTCSIADVYTVKKYARRNEVKRDQGIFSVAGRILGWHGTNTWGMAWHITKIVLTWRVVSWSFLRSFK